MFHFAVIEFNVAACAAEVVSVVTVAADSLQEAKASALRRIIFPQRLKAL
jgi:hypothetical protein